jgi:hypothetical protein
MSDDPRLPELSTLVQLPDYVVRKYIPDGVAGTEATIAEMVKLAQTGSVDWRIRMLLGRILDDADCEPKGYACFAEAIYKYCRDEVRYVFDPTSKEYLEAAYRIPKELGGSGIADCDSICVLEAALFLCCGFSPRFTTIRGDPLRPNEFTHVYCSVKYPGSNGFVGADATMPFKKFGWEPPEQFSRRHFVVEPNEDNSGASGMSNLGGLGYEIPQLRDAVSVRVNRWAQLTFDELNEPTSMDAVEDHVAGLSGFGDYNTVVSQFNTLWNQFMSGAFANPWSQQSTVRTEVDSIHSALIDFQNKTLPQVKSGSMSEADAVASLQAIASRINAIVPTVQSMSSSSDNPATPVSIPQIGGSSSAPVSYSKPMASTWYKNPWIWGAAGAVAILGLIAISRKSK